MSERILVTDAGFGPAPRALPPRLADYVPPGSAVLLANSDDPEALVAWFGDLAQIWVDFPGFADGRGFTLARRLRMAGYGGALYATGHVISEQYAMCRRVGFDAVVIDADLAARQPEALWLARADTWSAHHYQARLRA